MNKKRSSFGRFIRNIGLFFKRIPRRVERFSFRLDRSFGKMIFDDED